MLPVVTRLAAIATLAAATSATAGDIEIPARKAGEWQIQMAAEKPAKMPPMLIKACVDAATDKAMMTAGLAMNKDKCEKLDMTNEGGAIVIDSTCKFGPMKTTSHVVIEGDFNAQYTLKVTGSSAGGAKTGGMSMTQTATWMGAECTDGLQPGEMLMPGGMKVNATKMLQGMGGG